MKKVTSAPYAAHRAYAFPVAAAAAGSLHDHRWPPRSAALFPAYIAVIKGRIIRRIPLTVKIFGNPTDSPIISSRQPMTGRPSERGTVYRFVHLLGKAAPWLIIGALAALGEHDIALRHWLALP